MSHSQSEAWTLLIGEAPLGVLSNPNIDFPWTYCDFAPSEHYQEYAPYFDDRNRPEEDGDEDNDDPVLNSVCKKIDAQGRFYLVSNTSGQKNKHELTIHISGTTAWFRTSCMENSSI